MWDCGTKTTRTTGPSCSKTCVRSRTRCSLCGRRRGVVASPPGSAAMGPCKVRRPAFEPPSSREWRHTSRRRWKGLRVRAPACHALSARVRKRACEPFRLTLRWTLPRRHTATTRARMVARGLAPIFQHERRRLHQGRDAPGREGAHEELPTARHGSCARHWELQERHRQRRHGGRWHRGACAARAPRVLRRRIASVRHARVLTRPRSPAHVLAGRSCACGSPLRWLAPAHAL